MDRPAERKPWRKRRRKQAVADPTRGATRGKPAISDSAAKQTGHPPPTGRLKSRSAYTRSPGNAGRGPRCRRLGRVLANSDRPNATRITLSQDLLVPYGIPKWDIGMVRLSAVTPRGSYLTSRVPLVHIRTGEKSGYCLGDHARALGLETPVAALAHLRTYCDPRSQVEVRFIDAYRCFLEGCGGDPAQALAPIPQAHLYLDDPLGPAESAIPDFMIKADFAFWTGNGFLVVEIDGGSHIGNARHVTKDRALKASGVEVVHILNEEVLRWGPHLFPRLLSQIVK